MGRDKALMPFRGRPMVEIAVEKLRTFCAQVSLAGNREDLAAFAPAVGETHLGWGPGAGIEAGLLASREPWTLFVPVDVPGVPAALLRGWAEAVLAKAEAGCTASFLLVGGERQPAFCMVKQTAAKHVTAALDGNERRVYGLLLAVGEADEGWLWPVGAECFVPEAAIAESRMGAWFRNFNTPEDLVAADVEDGLEC